MLHWLRGIYELTHDDQTRSGRAKSIILWWLRRFKENYVLLEGASRVSISHGRAEVLERVLVEHLVGRQDFALAVLDGGNQDVGARGCVEVAQAGDMAGQALAIWSLHVNRAGRGEVIGKDDIDRAVPGDGAAGVAFDYILALYPLPIFYPD